MESDDQAMDRSNWIEVTQEQAEYRQFKQRMREMNGSTEISDKLQERGYYFRVPICACHKKHAASGKSILELLADSLRVNIWAIEPLKYKRP